MAHLKLYNIIIQEDGSTKVETELTPDEMRALLTVGVNAALQQGVMVASLVKYFPSDETESDISAEEEVYNSTIDDLLMGGKKDD